MNTIQSANITTDTKVFVRGDLDVPIETGAISDTTRLANLLETLTYIMDKGGIPVIAGHMGRPKGNYVEDLSTKQLLPYFNQHLGEGRFELLENFRFDPREKDNDPAFARELATKADIYVNDSFATCHRNHASITGIAKLLPAYAGLRLAKEIETLTKVRETPAKPLVLLIGGIKIEDKLPVIQSFLQTADWILLGGRTGLEWQGPVPANVIAPQDYARDNFDIGPETIATYKDHVKTAKTIVWAGPMGKFEDEEFLAGTREIAQAVATATQANGAFSVIGGGDTLNAAKKTGIVDKISFVSSGGGAMLKFLAGEELPGLAALA